MKKYAIIVAGGKGLRFGADLPKQFLLLKRKPVLMHTIERFSEYGALSGIILVIPRSHFEYWQKLCAEHNFTIPHKIAIGGEARFHSVKNGLDEIDGDGLVAVHDGVRPLVSLETIEKAFNAAAKFGAAIPVMDLVDSIREITANGSNPVNRDMFKLVQTPQVFKISLLKECYNQPFISEFTDDASVVEKAGYKVSLINGNRENIKITNQTDMLVAEAFINTLAD